jgi:hypothetical protein
LQAKVSKKEHKKGSLTIIGSGIRSADFTMSAKKYILTADKVCIPASFGLIKLIVCQVFFCVADPPTQTYIRRLRPDALDLYVLYDDTKVRYFTYVQMSEALLYYVRKGKNVLCVFYGHPGVFVLSSHRAVLIAKREGHHAHLRPGISALDCLVADLNVDPCFPGMQNVEVCTLFFLFFCFFCFFF